MIGWKRCHFTCGCLDEDSCLKAPKNQLQADCQCSLTGEVQRQGAPRCEVCDEWPLIAPRKPAGAEFYEGDSGDEDDHGKRMEKLACSCGPGQWCLSCP